jgi:hypothetical protein
MAQYISKVGYGLSEALPVLAPFPVRANRAPTTADKGYAIGTLWVYSAATDAYILMSVVNNLANWELLTSGGGAGIFSSLLVTPGPITLTGVFNLNTSGANAINIGTGTYSGTISIGNAAGTVGIEGANVEIDADAAGDIDIGLSVVGGDITVGGTAQTGDLVLGSSSGAQNVLIANGAGASVVAIANVQVGGSVSVGSAMVAGTISLGGLAQTGDINIGNSSATHTIDIGNEQTGAGETQTINIASNTIDGTSVVNILAGDATIGTQTANILTGAGVAGVANIGTGASDHVVNIGSATAGNQTNLLSPITALPGPVFVYTGAGAPANGLALHVGDLYIRTDAGGATERMYIATGVGAWTNVTCAA